MACSLFTNFFQTAQKMCEGRGVFALLSRMAVPNVLGYGGEPGPTSSTLREQYNSFGMARIEEDGGNSAFPGGLQKRLSRPIIVKLLRRIPDSDNLPLQRMEP